MNGTFAINARRPRKKRNATGFTLIELCIVLLVMAILMAAIFPSTQALVTESFLRGDARPFALMVRTAMLQSAGEKRPYVLNVSGRSMELHSAQNGEANDDALGAPPGHAAPAGDPSRFETSHSLDAGDQLWIPNPRQPSQWIPMPAFSCVFLPGALCPAMHIRLTRGPAFLEMRFNALTGNVESEASYLP